MMDLSHLFKWAFALSPFPAYLPQYFSMMQQLAADDDKNNRNSNHSNGKNASNGSVAIDRGGDFLRKRNLHDSPHSEKTTFGVTTNDDDTTSALISGTPSKPVYDGSGIISSSSSDEKDPNNNNNNNSKNNSSSSADGGLSRATVFLLLAAHLIRMLYFHGLVLEEQRPLPLRAGAGLERDDLLFKADNLAGGKKLKVDLTVGTMKSPQILSQASLPIEKPSAIQWDLLGQSCSMIVVQLMLLHGMMRLRRKNLRSRKKRLSANEVSLSCPNLASPPLMPPQKPSYANNLQSTTNNHATGSSSPLQQIWHRLSRATASHFVSLLSPVNIIQHHSFLEYMELLLLTCAVVTLLFDYHWYPRYRMQIVEWLKYTSIIFESCLALPQAIKNYGRGTTEGLSVVMVGGWVIGDFMKLCYFLLGMITSASGQVDSDASDGVAVGQGEDDGNALDGNNVFALGCLLALAMDLLVAGQMAWWYPTPEVLQLRERITRSVRHWKTNKDDDAGASLLMNGTDYDKTGMFASLIRSFFRWRQSSRPPLDPMEKNAK